MSASLSVVSLRLAARLTHLTMMGPLFLVLGTDITSITLH
jgi:hypothetical protein